MWRWITATAFVSLLSSLIAASLTREYTAENARMDRAREERAARVQAAKLACWEAGGTPVQSLQNGEVILCETH